MISRYISGILMISAALLASGYSARAQNPDETVGPRGFVRLMNAVGNGTGKLEVRIDGGKVREEGYELGDVTGGIPRKPNTYNVSFQRIGVESGETKVTLEKNETITLIPFAELVPATPEKEAYWKIRILKLKQLETKQKRTATIVNVTRDPELKIEIRQNDEKWEALVVKRLGLERTGIQQSSGYVPLRSGGKDLKPLSVGTSGNFVAVVYEDAAGAIRSQNFQDYKYLSAE
jgi:hypothetical protein